MRKKLLFITTRLFWPTDEGHKVLLYNYCKGLHDFYNYDIYLYSFLETGQNPDDGTKPNFIKKIVAAEEVSTIQKIRNAVSHSIVGKDKWTFQSSMYYSSDNVQNIQRLIEEIEPDSIMVDMIRLSRYYYTIKDFDGPKVLFMEDALSKRYLRQIAAASSESRIAGRYESKLPGVVNTIINSKLAKNMILKAETKRLISEEVLAAKNYDSVIYVNKLEATEMNEKSGKKNSYTVTMGADCDYFGADLAELGVKKLPNTLSYVGNMGVAANADAVRMIMNQIIPLIPSKPVIHFIGNCPDSLKAEYAGNPQCVFEGRVDDIRVHVKSTEVVLSPIAYGTGVKTKVIEGMAMSMPVVTNYLGIDGLSVEVGHDLLMSDDFNEIASMVEELLHNPVKREELGKNGHKYAMENHRWEDIYKVFGEAGL